MRSATSRDYSALEERLGHRFADPAILLRALTHRSWKEEQAVEEADNQRLEFLGDAVLGLVVAEELWAGLDLDEGGLSELRASLVSEPALHARALDLELSGHLRMGRGATRRGDAERASTLADAYEAVLAAVYLDGGIEAAREAVRAWLPAAVVEARSRPRDQLQAEVRHPKNLLQEWLQSRGRGTPSYPVIRQDGPNHDAVWSVHAVLEDGAVVGSGQGTSKREAETRAAEMALATLEAEESS